MGHCTLGALQPFSQNVRMPTVAKECQISLYDHVEADWENFGDSCSAGVLGDRLKYKELQFTLAKAAGGRVGRIWKGSKCPAEVPYI